MTVNANVAGAGNNNALFEIMGERRRYISAVAGLALRRRCDANWTKGFEPGVSAGSPSLHA